ncbi:MAG: zinc-ribbon domain-containing protein [Clostridia bacterium]|nr:zinc-ribbon domain-containing protein [Clostridia bacterium]
MKFCTHCGKEVMDDALICPNCGCSVQYDETPQGAAAPNAPQPQYRAPAPVDNYSTMSIIGLVLSFFTAFVGLIISVMAYNEAKNTGSLKSQSMAKAGIIIGAVEMGLGVLGVIIYIIAIIAFVGSFGALALI